MYGPSKDKRSSTNILENISSSFINIDQGQEESCTQEEKVESASLEILDYLVLAEQKLPCLKRKIAPRQVLTTMMMTLMMNMTVKSSYWNFKNS
jgi:hypothetical protein